MANFSEQTKAAVAAVEARYKMEIEALHRAASRSEGLVKVHMVWMIGIGAFIVGTICGHIL